MMRFMLVASIALLTLFHSLSSHADINQDILDTGAMFSYILDTGSQSASRIESDSLAQKKGWLLLPEESLDYTFNGDAVLLNDRIAVVLRSHGTGAEVYSFTKSGPTYQATLMPREVHGGSPKRLKKCEITEGNPGAATLRVTYASNSGDVVLSYRISTGQIHVEVLPETSTSALRVVADTDYLVIPDFFGDDVVYSATTSTSETFGLPAENFYLHLTESGNGIITCVSEQARQSIRGISAGGAGERRIIASEIECAADKSIWVAFSSQQDTWYAQELQPSKVPTETPLNWSPPFSAKWRSDFVVPGNEIAQSWNFAPSRQGKQRSLCWFQDSTAMVHPPVQNTEVTVPLVVYPIDRTQATPLNKFVLVDIMRSTLGVGPCQYILDIEGLDAQSTPTPALVSDWVEQLFKRKRAEKSRKKIAGRCAAMLSHVEHSEARIESYNKYSHEILAQLKTRPLNSKVAQVDILRLLKNLSTSINDLAAERQSLAYTEERIVAIDALIGQEDWQEDMDRISHELHAVGHAQDRTLAKCRMSLRLIEQRILREDATDPSVGALTILIQKILNTDTDK